jgi:predicted O-methyltransferase YrrM
MQWLALFTCAAVAAGILHAQGRGRGNAGMENPPPLASTDAEKKILAVINQMRDERTTYLSVPEADGRMLRLLTEAVNAKHVVEIGTSTGHSGLWFCVALDKTGGKLTTFEFDAGRAAMAKKHFAQAGVDRLVTVIEGDAHEKVKQLKGPVDVVFIDADKEGYVDYLEKTLPLVRAGGLILAHNVNMAEVRNGYLKKVTADPNLETVLYMQGGGMSVTLKKR